MIDQSRTASLCEGLCGPTTRISNLLLVENPARYLGNELNAVIKDPAQVGLRVALAFPDVYEVGMSHLGLKILYAIVNARPDFWAERVFAPWQDMEDLMRSTGEPLRTLESGTPVSKLDMIGFSLQYELCATTVLQMMDLAGMPLRAAERSAAHPFVVGGGPVTANPVPLSPFFDAFVIGDGEEAILELADLQLRWKESGGSREDLLRAWKEVPGVFVPSLHQAGDTVTRRILADLEDSPYPQQLVVPFCETVHDRVGIEIARGCTRGCRFCQAGMLYRPVRERRPETIVEAVRGSLEATGWEEVGLLSLSSGDYSHIADLVRVLVDRFASEKVALSLPSLRTDTVTGSIADLIRKVRKTGFTLAPEAGTDRLRRVINKGNTEEDLEKAVKTAFDHGWQAVKLYFMIGLPLETDDDLYGIVDLIRKASRWAGKGRIHASLSTFVPKAHTPFQWAGAISPDEISRRQHSIRDHFSRGRVRVKFHDARVSFLEAVLAAGDERLSDVIEDAFRNGARFDGWDDRLRFGIWLEAFERAGIDPHGYLQPKAVDKPLPWDFVQSGVERGFLAEEWRKAHEEQTTEDCRFGACQGCGVCDFERIMPRTASPWDAPAAPGDAPASAGEDAVRRFRLRYGKTGMMRFLGHHDVARVFNRAFRRTGMRLDHSRGFHPHPKLRFTPPTAFGVASVAEYVDFDLIGEARSPDEIRTCLGTVLPQGMNPMECAEIALNEGAVSGRIRYVTYNVSFADCVSQEQVIGRIEQFRSAGSMEITRMRKGRSQVRDLKDWVVDLALDASVLRLTIKAGQNGSVHILDAVAAILGLDSDTAKMLPVVKTALDFEASEHHEQGPLGSQ